MKRSQIFMTLLLIAGLNPVRAAEESPIRSGDRIAIVGNTFADQLRIHGYIETLLLQHADVSIRNLSWGGDMLVVRDRPTGFPTEESTLVSHKTDVIIACFGMGESFAGAGGLEDFKSDLKSGELHAEDLGGADHVLARGALNVQVTGEAKLEINQSKGLRLWIDNQEIPDLNVPIKVGRGRKVLTFGVDRKARQGEKGLRVELTTPSGSPLKFQIESGM